MGDLVYKQLGIPRRKVAYIAITSVSSLQKASGKMWGIPPVLEPGEY